MEPMLRPLLLDDIPRIQSIEQLCFPADTREDSSVYRRRIETFPEGNLGFLVADELAGFFCSELWNATQQLDPEQFRLSHDIANHHRSDGDLLYISSFAVDPQYRSILRGEKAFALAMDHLQTALSFRTAILLVAESWHPARRIYQQWGFTERMYLPAYFGESDGIIMQTASGRYPTQRVSHRNRNHTFHCMFRLHISP